jgi:FkbM family methyltransferase
MIYRDKIPSGRCVIDTSDPIVTPWVRSLIFWGFYESAELRLVEKYLPATLDVVELGASLGVVSAHIGRRLESGRQLISVEANPALVASLRANIASNAPQVRASVHNNAVFSGPDRPEFVELAFGDSNLAAWIRQPGDGAQSCRIRTATLSELLAAHGIGPYALVTDIEGAEAGLLLSEREALASCKLLIAELHDTEWLGRKFSVQDLVRLAIDEVGFVLRDQYRNVFVFGGRYS